MISTTAENTLHIGHNGPLSGCQLTFLSLVIPKYDQWIHAQSEYGFRKGCYKRVLPQASPFNKAFLPLMVPLLPLAKAKAKFRIWHLNSNRPSVHLIAKWLHPTFLSWRGPHKDWYFYFSSPIWFTIANNAIFGLTKDFILHYGILNHVVLAK